MFKADLVIQDARTGRVAVTLNKLAELGASARFRRLRSSVAYATRSGCQNLVSSLQESVNGWRGLHKRWLISIDFGRTEVEALRLLSGLANSEVRIPDAHEVLSNHLNPGRCFHPKTYVFDCDREAAAAPFAILIGSGNLTLSGLNTGVEHGTSLLWVAPLRRREAAILNQCNSEIRWWHEAWERATPFTRELLEQYREIRPIRPREDGTRSVSSFAADQPRVVDAHPGLAWANARYFWIETLELYKNRGVDQPGNQVDLRRGTRVYFGFAPDAVPRNTVLGKIAIQFRNQPASERSLRFGDNSMDKVILPIPGENGPDSYDHATILFERIGPRQFRIILGNHREAQQWQNSSIDQGMQYQLAGGRKFGFFN